MSLWTFAKITLTLKHPAAMASVSLPPRRVGESFHIPAGKGILDLMIEARKDALQDCKGVPDHRDFI
jgi:hypothetical protein